MSAPLIKAIADSEGKRTGWVHYCPGCDENHFIPTENYHITWDFNGSVEKPTFSPSVKLGFPADPKCHYWITDGQIRYCGDCKHDLKNQVLDLKPVDW